jgi:glyoxylase-like metal-dependent hydrolase (beta-lactamase superfamily II)
LLELRNKLVQFTGLFARFIATKIAAFTQAETAMSLKPLFTRLSVGLGLFAAATAALAQPLSLEVYNPGEQAVFPVSSTLISGEKEVILVDAQFSTREAQALVERIQASGKTLTRIFISHGDPDFYFGLDTLTHAYPDAKVLATPATIAYIEKSRAPKLAYWGPILKDRAPARTLVPEPLQGDHLLLEGQRIELVGHDPQHTSLWIPSLKAVVGGVLTSANIHLWVADAQTPAARQAWLPRPTGAEPRRPALHPRLPADPGARAGQGRGQPGADRVDAGALPRPARRQQPGAQRQGAQGGNAVALSPMPFT